MRQGRLAEEWMLPKLTLVENSRRESTRRADASTAPVSNETTAPAPFACARSRAWPGSDRRPG
jgi:hypothetical protein